MLISWLRFEWDLAKIPGGPVDAPSSFLLRKANEDEEAVVQRVVSSALSMDSDWADIQKLLLSRMSERVEESFAKDSHGTSLVLLHGSRVIGCSVIDPSENAESQLATGPCILHEYRNRGLGSLLLLASLAGLRDAGLRRAHAVTRQKTTAARFIYPKFGGVAGPWTPDFEISPRLAA